MKEDNIPPTKGREHAKPLRLLRAFRRATCHETSFGVPDNGIVTQLANAAIRHDPIGSFLIEKLKLNTIGFFALGVLAVAVLEGSGLLVYAINSSLSARALSQHLFSWPIFVLFWMVLPSLLAFYPWVTYSAGHLIRDLQSDGVIPIEGPNMVAANVRFLENLLSDRRWVYTALVIATAAQVYWVITGLGGDWAKVSGDIGTDIRFYMFMQLVLQTIGLYILLTSIARMLVIIGGLYQVFSGGEHGDTHAERVRIRPWHPDRCGGLGTLSKYAVRFSYFSALLGLWLVLNTYVSLENFGLAESLKTDSGLWVSVAGYVVLAPAMFFLTLGSARRAMLHAKSVHLHRVSRQLDEAYQGTREGHIDSGTELADSVTAVKLLNELYELTARFPVWPFDFVTIRRFTTAWIAPFLPVGIAYFVQWLLSLVP